MSEQLIGVTDSTENPIAAEALLRASRVVLTNPSESDRCRRRWARADVVLAAEEDRVISRRDGVAVVAIPPSEYEEAFDFIPDPVVLAIAPAGTAMPDPKRWVLVPRYAGCCYSIRVSDGIATVTELSRPSQIQEATAEADPDSQRSRRRNRRRRNREPVASEQTETLPEVEVDAPVSEDG